MKKTVKWSIILVLFVIGVNCYQMETSKAGIALIKSFEGCKLTAYQDLVGTWTIGYGHTKDVHEGMKISQHQADVILEVDLQEFEGYIKKYVEVPLSQNQFDALVSWVYNLGPNNLQRSTMLTILNEGNYDDVPYQLKRWNKAGGQVFVGLVRRRNAEAELFKNEPSN